MNERRLRTVVCGSTFGQFYLAALAALPDEFEIVGVLGRGSERTLECARRYGVPFYGAVDDLPADIDLACVVVRSGVLGGAGTELSLALLERGVHVIQEQPVHHDDCAACLRVARRRGLQFRVGDLYVQLPAVRRFTAATRAAMERQPALFIDAACSTQVSFPWVHLLGTVLKTVRPWSIQAQAGDGPLQLLTGSVGGIPLVLRAHNEVDPADPDNHIHLLHRITIGFAGGSVALTDTHGPVVFYPRLHIPQGVKARFDFEGSESGHLWERSSITLGPPCPPPYRDILAHQWPRAIGRELSALRVAVLQGTGPGRAEQSLLTLARLWQQMTGALGYPRVVPGRHHQPLAREPLAAAAESIGAEPEECDSTARPNTAAPSPRAPSAQDVFGCTEPAERAVQGISPEHVRAFVAQLDEAVLSSMLLALQAQGVLDDPLRAHTVPAILERTGAVSRHHALVRRWLRALVERGWLAQTGDSLLGRPRLNPAEVRARWDRARALWEGGLGSREFIDYLRVNAERLPALMRDQQQATLLLFPEGRTDVADAVYRQTITARYLNAAIGEAVRRIARNRKDKLRIVEVGAGTGATTEAVARAQQGSPSRACTLDYLFTDVSSFFLADAKERFRDHPWMRFGLYDIDRDPTQQGLAAADFDVVIAAGVLNNARHAERSVRSLLRLLSPEGFLLMTEPTREHLEILISQAFMMTPPQDDRQRTDTTFLSVEQWSDCFRSAGAAQVAVFPPEDHPIAPLGQRLFVVRGH